MTAIHHLAIRVSDCVASAAFYAHAFGLSEVRRVEEDGRVRAVWLRAGDVVVMLEHSIRPDGPVQGSGHVLVLSTPDLASAEAHLQRLGVTISDRTANTLYFQDPDGHRCGLSAYHFE